MPVERYHVDGCDCADCTMSRRFADYSDGLVEVIEAEFRKAFEEARRSADDLSRWRPTGPLSHPTEPTEPTVPAHAVRAVRAAFAREQTPQRPEPGSIAWRAELRIAQRVHDRPPLIGFGVW